MCLFHGSVKTEVVGELRNVIRSSGDGYLFSDQMRVSCPAADLSAEPDVVYLSDDAIDSGPSLDWCQAAGGELDSFVELEARAGR